MTTTELPDRWMEQIESEGVADLVRHFDAPSLALAVIEMRSRPTLRRGYVAVRRVELEALQRLAEAALVLAKRAGRLPRRKQGGDDSPAERNE